MAIPFAESEEEIVTLQCLYASHDGVLVFKRNFSSRPPQGLQEGEGALDQRQTKASSNLKGPLDGGAEQQDSATSVDTEPKEKKSLVQTEGAEERLSDDATRNEAGQKEEEETPLPSDGVSEDGGETRGNSKKAESQDHLRRFAKSRYTISFYNTYASRREKDVQFVGQVPH